jgi:cytochrome c5
VSGFSRTSQSQLPDGPGAAVVRTKCLTCHGADLIVQQRLSPEGWSRELDKMVGWGAQLDGAERGAALDYLTAASTPTDPARAAEAEEGASILARRCVACHDMGLIDQQRLTADGWRREVDKMIGWGAAVSTAEQEPLIAHLVKRQPVVLLYRPH